jgi:hypothetical protein
MPGEEKPCRPVPPEITTVGKLLDFLNCGELSGIIVEVGATSKNVATRNWKALRGLRQRAGGRLTADVLKRWIAQVVNADDSNVSYARVLSSYDLRKFSDALDKAVRPAAKPQTNQGDDSNFRHSNDFRSVIWNGTPHTFNKSQADCIAVLWEAWEKGTPELHQTTILAQADDRGGLPTKQYGRLIDVFRSKSEGKHVTHSAWHTMILPGHSRGTYRLQEQAADHEIPTATSTPSPT